MFAAYCMLGEWHNFRLLQLWLLFAESWRSALLIVESTYSYLFLYHVDYLCFSRLCTVPVHYFHNSITIIITFLITIIVMLICLLTFLVHIFRGKKCHFWQHSAMQISVKLDLLISMCWAWCRLSWILHPLSNSVWFCISLHFCGIFQILCLCVKFCEPMKTIDHVNYYAGCLMLLEI